jgi:hypothetical protein
MHVVQTLDMRRRVEGAAAVAVGGLLAVAGFGLDGGVEQDVEGRAEVGFVVSISET